jgi:hypothetical protein
LRGEAAERFLTVESASFASAAAVAPVSVGADTGVGALGVVETATPGEAIAGASSLGEAGFDFRVDFVFGASSFMEGCLGVGAGCLVLCVFFFVMVLAPWDEGRLLTPLVTHGGSVAAGKQGEQEQGHRRVRPAIFRAVGFLHEVANERVMGRGGEESCLVP